METAARPRQPAGDSPGASTEAAAEIAAGTEAEAATAIATGTVAGTAAEKVRRVRKAAGNKLTAMLQVRNERGRYLERVLGELCEFVDEIVVVDDASDDGTADACRACPRLARLVELPRPLFGEEWRLRSLLWQAALTCEPDWLLAVDADELYDDDAKSAMRSLIDQDRYDWVAFRLYDMWGGTTHYRDDEHWNAHRRHTMTLVRRLPGYPCDFPPMNHHVPRLPPVYAALPGLRTDFRIQHLGWAGGWEERIRKYHRYKRLDPDCRWGSAAQYESILDVEPNLVPWKEE